MSNLTILSEQQLGASEGDSITVVLVEPDDMPPSVIIHWPPAPTTANPRDFGDLAALLTRVFPHRERLGTRYGRVHWEVKAAQAC